MKTSQDVIEANGKEEGFKERAAHLKHRQEEFKRSYMKVLRMINFALEAAATHFPNEAGRFRSLIQIDYKDEMDNMLREEITMANIERLTDELESHKRFRRKLRVILLWLQEIGPVRSGVFNSGDYARTVEDAKAEVFEWFPEALWELREEHPQLLG